jgi:hypothetical protein
MPGVYVAHSKGCPAFDDPKARCRCTPSWRGRRRNPFTGRPEWQRPVVKNRAEVLSWLAASRDNKEQLLELAARGPSFEEPPRSGSTASSRDASAGAAGRASRTPRQRFSRWAGR